jgi:plasmid maintenance system antidote protein VapI
MAKNSSLLAGPAPVHPGALLRDDLLPHVKMSKSGTAKALGISRANCMQF